MLPQVKCKFGRQNRLRALERVEETVQLMGQYLTSAVLGSIATSVSANGCIHVDVPPKQHSQGAVEKVKADIALDLRNPALPRNLARMAATLIKMPVSGPVPATGFWTDSNSND
jgi:hypothetical protein